MNSPSPRPNHPPGRRRLSGWWAALVGWLLIVGCTTQSKQKWLTFFFDGVPQPGQTTNALVGVVATQTNATNLVAPVAAPPARPPLIKHPPFANRECTACHESTYSQKMRGKAGEVCFDCHKTARTNFFAGKIKHQPVENGECTACHAPHLSEFKKLLIKPVGKLCFECH